MSQIKDYLEQGRAGKVYDPNQGLYMDPKEGKAFVPTFTNIADSNIQGEVESRMGGPSKADASPYLVSGGPGAMPARGEAEAPQRPDARDPYAMAAEHTKSNQFKNELYQEMFGRDPQSGFNSEQERTRFYNGLKSARNVIVDRLKYQIDRKDKADAASLKNARKQMGQKESMELLTTYREKYANERTDDPESWESKYAGKTPDEIAKQKFVEDLQFTESVFAEGKTGEAMPGRGKGKAVEMGGAEGEEPYRPYPESTIRKSLSWDSLDPEQKQKAIRYATEKTKAAGVDPASKDGKEMFRKIVKEGFEPEDIESGEYKSKIREKVAGKMPINAPNAVFGRNTASY